jgi:putative oxidoreductase
MPLPDKLKKILGSPLLQVLARMALGGIFIYASLDKIAQPMQFTRVIESYKILPLSLLTLPALILPWVELFAGICLVSGLCVRSAAMVLSALLVFFILALGVNVIRGITRISCGCFSNSIGDSENIYVLIVRDLLIMIPGLLIVFFSQEKKDS